MRQIIALYCLAGVLLCVIPGSNPIDSDTRMLSADYGYLVKPRYSTARCLNGSTVERFDDRGPIASTTRRRKCLV